MPRGRREGRGRRLRLIPDRFCRWRRALPERVVLQPLPGPNPGRCGARRELGVYVRSISGPELRQVGVVRLWFGGWSGEALAHVYASGDGLRGTVWSILAAQARADHQLAPPRDPPLAVAEVTGHRPQGPRHTTACVLCMLREAGYTPAPPPDYYRGYHPTRDRWRPRFILA